MSFIDESTKNLGKKITEATMASLNKETELNEGPIGRVFSGIGNAAMAALGSGTAKGKQKQQAGAQHLMNQWKQFTAINNKPWNQDNILYFLGRMFGDEAAANISAFLFPAAPAKAKRTRTPKPNPNASPQAPAPAPAPAPNGAAVNPNAAPQAANNMATQTPSRATESIQEAVAPTPPQSIYNKETVYKMFYVIAGKMLDNGGMTVGDSQWTKKINKFFGVVSTGDDDTDHGYGNARPNDYNRARRFDPETTRIDVDLLKNEIQKILQKRRINLAVANEIMILAKQSKSVADLMTKMANSNINSSAASLAIMAAHA